MESTKAQHDTSAVDLDFGGASGEHELYPKNELSLDLLEKASNHLITDKHKMNGYRIIGRIQRRQRECKHIVFHIELEVLSTYLAWTDIYCAYCVDP